MYTKRAWALTIAAVLLVSCGVPQSADPSSTEVLPAATMTEAPGTTAWPTAFPTNLTHLSGPYFGQQAPGPAPVGLGSSLMTGEVHSSPVFSPDGLEAYWAAWDTGIHVSRLENGYWTRPQRLAFSESPAVDRDPFLAPSGDRMFFVSTAPLQDPEQPGKENIWFVDRTATGWGEPQPLNTDINSYELHWQVSVDNQGNLYFGAKQGVCADIYFSRYSDGEYGKAVRLGDSVNTTELCEMSPYIAPDGSYLIFPRWDPATRGAVVQLYISYADQDGNWSEAVLIPHIRYGNCPLVSPDGKYLIFLSSPHSVSWMSTDFIEELRPMPAAPDISGLDVISAASVDRVERLFALTGHTQRVTDVAFSPQGGILASCSRDGTIRIWDLQNMQELHSFAVRTPDLNCMTFSPDGRWLASGAAVWDVHSGEVVYQLSPPPSEVAHVAFSPDGKILAVAETGQPARLWDMTNGQVLRTFERQPGEAAHVGFGIAFSRDGRLLASGGRDGIIRFWEVASGKLASTFDYGMEVGLHAIAFSPDGRLLASGGTNSQVRLWEVASAQSDRSLPAYQGLYGLAFSPDGLMLAVAGPSRTIDLWDITDDSKLISLPHADELMSVAFSPDGTLLASGGYDNTIVIWGARR